MVSVEYLAGFIDGEGSLSLSRIPRGQSYHEYCARVTISNTDRTILKEIQEDWGGTIHSMGVRRPGWKPGFVLVWTNAAVARLLRQARNHLLVKARHVEALLEFTEHLQKCERQRDELGRLLPFSEAEIEVREVFFNRLKRLNLKGVAGSSQSTAEPDFEGQGHEGVRISPRYLAGFMDGEGSLMITKSRSRKSGRVRYQARLTVTNTDKGILEGIRREYGGTIHCIGRGKSNWKLGYMLVWSEGLIASLLSVVGPHLRLKRRQAAVQSEFIGHRKETFSRYGRFLANHPKEVARFREVLYQQMKGLNARGAATS